MINEDLQDMYATLLAYSLARAWAISVGEIAPEFPFFASRFEFSEESYIEIRMPIWIAENDLLAVYKVFYEYAFPFTWFESFYKRRSTLRFEELQDDALSTILATYNLIQYDDGSFVQKIRGILKTIEPTLSSPLYNLVDIDRKIFEYAVGTLVKKLTAEVNQDQFEGFLRGFHTGMDNSAIQ